MKRLDSQGPPYLCLNGTIFERYRARLSAEGIPTPLALYTCLRLVGSAKLDFSEYPYAQRKDGPVPRPTLVALLENFLLDRPGPVSWQELRHYGQTMLGMASWQFSIHLKSATGVLQIGKREFVLHRSHQSLVLDALIEITGQKREFHGAAPLSAEWLYRHNAARCNEAGITGVACLTSLIRHFSPPPPPGRCTVNHIAEGPGLPGHSG